MMIQNGLINIMENKLFDLLNEYTSADFEFKREVRIYHDLNIYGDDATDFLKKFSKAFEVDIANFNYSDYFPSEGDWILPSLIRMLTFQSKIKYKELTIEMLLQSIKVGRL